MNINILAEACPRSPATTELVGLELTGPEPGVETGSIAHSETAVMGRVVAGKLHPLLQTQTVVGRHIPGLPDPLEITGKTFRRPGETLCYIGDEYYLSLYVT